MSKEIVVKYRFSIGEFVWYMNKLKEPSRFKIAGICGHKIKDKMKVYYMIDHIHESLYPCNIVPENEVFKTRKELESFYKKK